MTTITPITRTAVPAYRTPAMVRAVLGAFACAALVLLTGFMILACLSMPMEMNRKLAEDLQARIIAAGTPMATCGSDGSLVSDEPVNCRDREGFRIVLGDRIRIFSLRHARPMFVFGMANGLVFTNEKISRTLLESEKSSFMRYMMHAHG